MLPSTIFLVLNTIICRTENLLALMPLTEYLQYCNEALYISMNYYFKSNIYKNLFIGVGNLSTFTPSLNSKFLDQ